MDNYEYTARELVSRILSYSGRFPEIEESFEARTGLLQGVVIREPSDNKIHRLRLRGSDILVSIEAKSTNTNYTYKTADINSYTDDELEDVIQEIVSLMVGAIVYNWGILGIDLHPSADEALKRQQCCDNREAILDLEELFDEDNEDIKVTNLVRGIFSLRIPKLRVVSRLHDEGVLVESSAYLHRHKPNTKLSFSIYPDEIIVQVLDIDTGSQAELLASLKDTDRFGDRGYYKAIPKLFSRFQIL